MPDKVTTEFQKYPTGAIGKGEFCDCCKRFNARHVTCSVIGIKNNQILLIKRGLDPQKGFWALPGGYLDWDETTEDCAEREFFEETGYKVVDLKLLGVYSQLDRDKDGRQNVECTYYGHVSDKLGEADHEIADLAWFNLENLPEELAFDHAKIIQDYIKIK